MEIPDDIETRALNLVETKIEIKDEPIDLYFDDPIEGEYGSFTEDQNNELDAGCLSRVCNAEKEDSEEELPLPYVVTVGEEDDVCEMNFSDSAHNRDAHKNAQLSSQNLHERIRSREDQIFSATSNNSKETNARRTQTLRKVKKSRRKQIFPKASGHSGETVLPASGHSEEIDLPSSGHSEEMVLPASGHSKEMVLPQEGKERDRKTFVCEVCGRGCTNMKGYKIHLLSHRNKQSFYCVVCDLAFPTATRCRNHEETHSELKCICCGFVAPTLHSLRRHMKQDHENDRVYNCEKCDLTFTFRQAFEYHALSHLALKEEDSGWRPYLCDRCGKRFTLGCSLYAHMSKHFDQKGANFGCEDCGKRFMTRCGLNGHVKRAHQKYQCNYCGKEYGERKVLQRHIKEIHVVAKEFECEFCGASFVRLDRLREHVRLHTGERPYACDMCDMKYASSSVLRNHKKIIHFGMKLGKKDSGSEGELEQEVPLSVVMSRLQKKKVGKRKMKRRSSGNVSS